MNYSCSLIISSTDKSSYLWDLYSNYQKKYWQDCPFSVYLINESINFNISNSIFSKQILSESKHWSTMLLNSLKNVHSKYVILNFEDQIPIRKVSNQNIYKCLNFMDENSAGLIQIWRDNPLNFSKKLKFNIIKFGSNYRLSCSTGIWNKDFLVSCLEINETPWQFEKIGSFRFKSRNMPVYSTNFALFRFLNIQRKGTVRYKAKKIIKNYINTNKLNSKSLKFQSIYSHMVEQFKSISLNIIYFFIK